MNMHRVMVLAIDGVLPMDLGIPTQIFNARPNTPYELTVCGDTEEAVTTSAGFTLGLTAGLEALADADTIIVPGFEDFRRPPHPRVRAALKLARPRRDTHRFHLHRRLRRRLGRTARRPYRHHPLGQRG